MIHNTDSDFKQWLDVLQDGDEITALFAFGQRIKGTIKIERNESHKTWVKYLIPPNGYKRTVETSFDTNPDLIAIDF